MKKKSKIKIIKDKESNSSSNGYTFLNDFNNTFSTSLSSPQLNNKENDKSVKVEEKHSSSINKAPIDKKDILKLSKGLKFSKPSQRNHSSIYE